MTEINTTRKLRFKFDVFGNNSEISFFKNLDDFLNKCLVGRDFRLLQNTNGAAHPGDQHELRPNRKFISCVQSCESIDSLIIFMLNHKYQHETSEMSQKLVVGCTRSGRNNDVLFIVLEDGPFRIREQK
jgi:hypothetical protein